MDSMQLLALMFGLIPFIPSNQNTFIEQHMIVHTYHQLLGIIIVINNL